MKSFNEWLKEKQNIEENIADYTPGFIRKPLQKMGWMGSSTAERKKISKVPAADNSMQSEQLKDAIKDGQEWNCPHCAKPLTENELKKSVCSGCWNKIRPRNMTWYGLEKPEIQKHSPSTMPLGSRTWKAPSDWDYHATINPGDANRLGGI